MKVLSRLPALLMFGGLAACAVVFLWNGWQKASLTVALEERAAEIASPSRIKNKYRSDLVYACRSGPGSWLVLPAVRALAVQLTRFENNLGSTVFCSPDWTERGLVMAPLSQQLWLEVIKNYGKGSPAEHSYAELLMQTAQLGVLGPASYWFFLRVASQLWHVLPADLRGLLINRWSQRSKRHKALELVEQLYGRVPEDVIAAIAINKYQKHWLSKRKRDRSLEQ